jgi:hypothetical protein
VALFDVLLVSIPIVPTCCTHCLGIGSVSKSTRFAELDEKEMSMAQAGGLLWLLFVVFHLTL